MMNFCYCKILIISFYFILIFYILSWLFWSLYFFNIFLNWLFIFIYFFLNENFKKPSRRESVNSQRGNSSFGDKCRDFWVFPSDLLLPFSHCPRSRVIYLSGEWQASVGVKSILTPEWMGTWEKCHPSVVVLTNRNPFFCILK